MTWRTHNARVDISGAFRDDDIELERSDDGTWRRPKCAHARELSRIRDACSDAWIYSCRDCGAQAFVSGMELVMNATPTTSSSASCARASTSPG